MGALVFFPPGKYLATSIHLRSNVELMLAPRAVIVGAPDSFDFSEPSLYGHYQDFGHSHFHDSLMSGENITLVPHDTGFETGVKLELSLGKNPDSGSGAGFGVTLYLMMALESGAGGLVFTVAAKEGQAVGCQLDWPTALDPNEADYTILSNRKGELGYLRRWRHCCGSAAQGAGSCG